MRSRCRLRRWVEPFHLTLDAHHAQPAALLRSDSDDTHVAHQDFNIEKLQLLESEKAKIRKDYERREGQIEVKKKM